MKSVLKDAYVLYGREHK